MLENKMSYQEGYEAGYAAAMEELSANQEINSTDNLSTVIYELCKHKDCNTCTDKLTANCESCLVDIVCELWNKLKKE